jgi:hypothetical protein
LRGLPKPPETLRLNVNGTDIVLTGSEAKEFFTLPAIVEVYITEKLTQEELGCFYFHLGELQHQGVATNVYFVAHRYESSGSVLRFQAKSYAEIYQVLPDLLAPFRMAGAVDWKRTIQAIPSEHRGEAITALVKMETKRPTGLWRFAGRMAEVFHGYRNAKVFQIREGRNQGLRIDLFTDQQIAERLARIALPELWDGRSPLMMITQEGHSHLSIGGVNMDNRTQIGGDAIGSAFGSGTVNAHDITVYKNAVDSSARLDNDIKQKLKDVVDDLNKLTAELEKPQNDASRVQRYWNHIKEIAPPAASILASAASLAKLLGIG